LNSNKLFQYIKKNVLEKPIFLIFFFAGIVHLKQLIAHRVTGWDSFDVLTVNFIFMSDALKSGSLPLWNPFVLGGIPLF